MTEYSLAKTGDYPRIFPNFQNCTRCEKDLKNNKHNSLHLGRKYVRIFVLGHHLFLAAQSFPGDNVRRKISQHIFAPHGGLCLFSKSSHEIDTCKTAH